MEALLGLLLDAPFSHKAWSNTDWDLFLKIAQKNTILLRASDILRTRGVSLPAKLLESVQKENDRVQTTVEIIKKLSRICTKDNISYLLPTALQHYPDMGGDVDVVVPDGSRRIDILLKRELGAGPLPGSLLNRLSTESAFTLGPSLPSIEVHYGRIGLMGEHHFYTTLLFKNRRTASLDGVDIPVLSPEDYLLTQTIQRLYCRFYFRISDFVYPIKLLLNESLDWDYIMKTAALIGLSDGLGMYLSYLNKIYYTLLGRSVLPASVEKSIRNNRYGGIAFKRPYYRYPTLLVTGKLYWNKFTTDVFSGRLASAVRLCFFPCVAMSFLMRNIEGKKSRYFENMEERKLTA